eukprot:1240378-Rhodomonas_salina.1
MRVLVFKFSISGCTWKERARPSSHCLLRARQSNGRALVGPKSNGHGSVWVAQSMGRGRKEEEPERRGKRAE